MPETSRAYVLSVDVGVKGSVRQEALLNRHTMSLAERGIGVGRGSVQLQSRILCLCPSKALLPKISDATLYVRQTIGTNLTASTLRGITTSLQKCESPRGWDSCKKPLFGNWG